MITFLWFPSPPVCTLGANLNGKISLLEMPAMNEIENINDKKIFEHQIINDTFSRHKISVMI